MTQTHTPSRVRTAVRISLVLGLLCAGYTAIQGIANWSTLALLWGAVTPWMLVLDGLGCVVLALALRRAPGSPAALRFGFCVLVGWWAVYVFALQPYNRFAVEVSLGVAAGVYGLGVLVGPRVVRFLPDRLRRGLDFAVFMTCLSLFLLEAGLKTLAVIRPSPLFAVVEGAVITRLRSHSFAPGQVVLGTKCNARGFYDTEFLPRHERSHPAAVVIGDSFVAGIVPHGWNFTTVAEEFLDGAELYSMGVPGTGPDQYLYLLENEAVQLQPDLVVITLFAGNDLVETSTSKGTDRVLAQWLDRECVLLLEVPRRLLAIEAAGVAPRRDRRTPEQMPWLQDHRLEKAVFPRETYVDLVAARVRATCIPQPRRMQSLFAVLARMREVAGDSPMAVVLAPAEFQVEDSLWDEVVAVLPGVEGLQRDRVQREVGAWLEEQGIPYLDLLPVLRAQPAEPDGDRHLYHLQDSHWNARGNRVVGKALAEFVRPWLQR